MEIHLLSVFWKITFGEKCRNRKAEGYCRHTVQEQNNKDDEGVTEVDHRTS